MLVSARARRRPGTRARCSARAGHRSVRGGLVSVTGGSGTSGAGGAVRWRRAGALRRAAVRGCASGEGVGGERRAAIEIMARERGQRGRDGRAECSARGRRAPDRGRFVVGGRGDGRHGRRGERDRRQRRRVAAVSVLVRGSTVSTGGSSCRFETARGRRARARVTARARTRATGAVGHARAELWHVGGGSSGTVLRGTARARRRAASGRRGDGERRQWGTSGRAARRAWWPGAARCRRAARFVLTSGARHKRRAAGSL